MKTATIVLTLAGLGIGFLAGKLAIPSNDDEVTELETRVETAHTEAAELEDARKELDRKAQSLETKNRRLQKDLNDAREQHAATRKRVEELQAANDALTDEPESVDDATTAGNVPIAFEQYSEALASVNWKKDVGENMAAMVPHIIDILEAIQAGTPPPPEAVGATQRYNGPLVTVAMKLTQAGIPGTGANGSFSHPAVMVNSIAATLEAAGLPLDTSGLGRLKSLGTDYTARDDRRLAAYDARTFELEKVSDEAALKREFFEAAFKLLTEEQVETLSPAASRGRLRADLFSETLVWVGRVSPTPFDDRVDLATKTGQAVVRNFKLPEELSAQITQIVTDWANSIPEDRLDYEMDGLDKIGMYRGNQVLEGSRETLRLLHSLSNGLDLDDEQTETFRAFGFTTVLLRKPPG